MVSTNTTVLVVDDDGPLVDLISSILQEAGYSVETAFNGQEGLNLAKESPPNLILMDLRMPVMDGWTCCRLLRGSEETQRIPVIMMSSDGARDSIQPELGIEDFLHKPFEVDDLLNRVKRFATPTGKTYLPTHG